MTTKIAKTSLLSAGAFALSVSAVAQERDVASYRFQTQLVPLEHVSTSFGAAKDGVWVRGSLLPDRVIRLTQPARINDKSVSLASDDAFGLAYTTNSSIIACSVVQVIKFRLGKSHLCLIDRDGDRLFDGWFRRGDEIVIAHGSRRIPDNIQAISPIGFDEVASTSLESVRTQSGFVIQREGRSLNFCRTYWEKIESFCMRGIVKWDKDQASPQIEVLNGIFEYRSVPGNVEVRLVSPVERQLFVTQNY